MMRVMTFHFTYDLMKCETLKNLFVVFIIHTKHSIHKLQWIAGMAYRLAWKYFSGKMKPVHCSLTM